MAEKRIDLGDVKHLSCVTPSDFTSFFGEAEGTDYPYIEFDYDPGYTCGRCNGRCDKNRPPCTTASIVIWE